MGIFGSQSQRGETPLDQILSGIEEPIEERALAQYYVSGSRGEKFWALLLLTGSTFYVIYGEGQNWLSKMMQSGQPAQHMESVPLESIEQVNVPERGGFWTRLVRGPTRMAEIERRDGDTIRLEIDSSADGLLEALRARLR